MPSLHIGVPLWLVRGTRNKKRYPTLRGRVEVDVAIVGGGITGAVVAHAFATAGVKVAIVEARSVGRGSTAASTALLMRETDADLRELERRYGRAAARRVWELCGSATHDFIATLRRLKIECDLQERESIYYTTAPDCVGPLHKELRHRHSAGFSGAWLDRAALRSRTHIDGEAAIRTKGNAQFDPYRACLGMLRAAEKAGAQIFERSLVRRIERPRGQVRLVTSGGTIVADRVIIATGYATPDFKPLAGRFTMKHTYVLATKRVGIRARRQLGLGDVMLWDTQRPYHYARWTDDHRLLLGGEDRPLLPKRQRRRAFTEGTRALQEYFERLLPPLAGVGIDHRWEGLFATTSDGLPYIGPHRRYPRHLFALGYGGNGMTFAFLAARLLLEYFRGEKSADHRLFAFGRHSRR